MDSLFHRTVPQTTHHDHRITWEEQDSVSNSNICDIIILHLYASEGGKEQQVPVITVYVSTGTIFIQGRWFCNFGKIEFPLLLDIINKMSHSNPNHNVTKLYQTTPPNFFKQDLILTPCTTDKDGEHEEIEDSDKKKKMEVKKHWTPRGRAPCRTPQET